MSLPLLSFAFAALLLAAPAPARAQSAPPSSPLLDQGYHDMYDIDFDGAHQSFNAFIQSHPDDPLGPASDAAAYLFSEFEKLKILDLNLIDKAPSQNWKSRRMQDLEDKFQQRVHQANVLARKALTKNPRDTSALLASALTNGLESYYAALIQKNNLAALRYSKRATAMGHKTLAVDPDCYDAYLAAGVENYMLGVKSAPERWFLDLTGARANASTGVHDLRLTADKGHYLAPFARLLLATADMHFKKYGDARDQMKVLAERFPGNPVYARLYRDLDKG
jgi:hypothetical protein